ncbi:hypothetical protein SAMN05421858_1796 [Haladaptatus litoreus]|uniref:DUF8100 domain-containing protein n=1 Tax=Haladaptatus litoreus TaxID=553468 RepID=A0A1N6YZ67_9EURY|nr:hypothetical protein [Haladaptatus litoreus]SIR19912.1 hypothetical protein SAMN05421858_1796 [Haladaptatus litoreus]
MNRERLGRFLSASLVPLGILLLALGVMSDDVVSVGLGGGTVILGGLFFWAIGRFPDAEFDLTEAPSFVVNLIELGGILIVFALLIYLLGDLESVTRLFRTGIPSPQYVAYAGLSMGLFLGGGVAYFMQRWDTVGETMANSALARTIGFSFTFGTFLLLLLYQPPSSVLYAGAYSLSRIGILGWFYIAE